MLAIMSNDIAGYKDSILENQTMSTRIICKKCVLYMKSVLHNMSPNEANWFQECAAEIELNDGHLILERFLRLYRAFYRGA